jgi:chemotaxis protein methyltransferase WspC
MSALERIGAVLRGGQIDPALASPRAIAPLAEDRRRSVGARDLEEYAALVESDRAEASRLRSLVAVPETWMFRYPESFELLRARLLAAGGAPFRALCIACATGAEPLSVAATAVAAGIAPEAIEVTGMDPNPDALRQGRDAALGRMAARGGVPPWADRLVRVAADGTPTVAPEVRACVRFVEGRAPEDLPRPADGRFDAVFCRNLAIYLAPEARRAIGARIVELVRPGGMLFLGHAERLPHFGIEDAFRPADAGHPGAFAAERVDAAAPVAPASAAAWLPPRHAPPAPPAARRAPAPPQPAADAAPRREAARPAADALEAIRALADRGDLRDALDAARRLHDAGNREVPLLELLGTLHLALGEHAQAEAVLRSVAYLDPGNATALVQLGVLAERRGDAEQAARYRARAARSRA